MLKKQYLDERCAGTIAQAQCENNPSPALLNSISQPRGLPTISGEPLNIWRSAVNGSRGPSVVPAAHSAPIVQKKSKSTLTGQGWYTQSASRAVNQVLLKYSYVFSVLFKPQHFFAVSRKNHKT